MVILNLPQFAYIIVVYTFQTRSAKPEGSTLLTPKSAVSSDPCEIPHNTSP